jgi:hypothetical protein
VAQTARSASAFAGRPCAPSNAASATGPQSIAEVCTISGGRTVLREPADRIGGA